jgi:hypothetical protein
MGSVVPIGAVVTMAAVVITRAEVTGGGAAVVVVAEEAMVAAEELEPDISDTRLLEFGLLEEVGIRGLRARLNSPAARLQRRGRCHGC